MKRLALGLAVTLGLCLGLGASAQATPAAPAASTVAATAAPPTAQADAAAAQAAEVREAKRLTPFIDAGTATLDAAGALDAGVDATVVRDFQSGLAWGKAQRTESLDDLGWPCRSQ